jgi:hypothetical protein
MSRRALLFVAIGLSFMSAPVDIASGQSRPREPLSPGVSVEKWVMNPRFRIPDVPISADAIRIQNFGNVQLGLVYWDGEAEWREVRLDSGKSEVISCKRCGSKMTVQFHNGKDVKKEEIDLGGSYVLRWSEEKKEWELLAANRLPAPPLLMFLRSLPGSPCPECLHWPITVA